MPTRFQDYNRSMGRDGTYRSQDEAAVAKRLVASGLTSVNYETVKLRFTKVSTYRADFSLAVPGIGQVLLEVKGWWSPEDRRKIRSVISCNPTTALLMVLARPDHKISKGSRTNYGEFCSRHAIPWLPLKALLSCSDPCQLIREALLSAGITPVPGATAQTEPPPTQMGMFTASSAKG
jgi:hypothetical protein